MKPNQFKPDEHISQHQRSSIHNHQSSVPFTSTFFGSGGVSYRSPISRKNKPSTTLIISNNNWSNMQIKSTLLQDDVNERFANEKGKMSTFAIIKAITFIFLFTLMHPFSTSCMLTTSIVVVYCFCSCRTRRKEQRHPVQCQKHPHHQTSADRSQLSHFPNPFLIRQ